MSRIENFKQGVSGPKIVGANEVKPGPIQTLDSKTKQDAEPIQVVVHSEVITERDKIRGRKLKSGDPEIRIRQQPSQVEWDRIKRAEDE